MNSGSSQVTTKRAPTGPAFRRRMAACVAAAFHPWHCSILTAVLMFGLPWSICAWSQAYSPPQVTEAAQETDALMAEALAHPDAAEGAASFTQRRAPDFAAWSGDLP